MLGGAISPAGPKLQGIFTADELQRYSRKFLCGLFRMSHGNVDNSVRGFDVFFKNVRPEAYERPSFGYQATNELILDLIQKGFIERETAEYVKLTPEGLNKCKVECHGF